VPDFSDYGPRRRVDGGIRARSERGAIGESWWSQRFLAVLESLALGSRLSRGRSYARTGQVLTLSVAPGVVTASVQGSRPDPYAVRIGLPRLDEPTWHAVESAMAAQAIYSARLLAGEMPHGIEEVFGQVGAALFPARAADLAMSCSCPDFQVPCKHLAATFYLLAEAFDTDPFQILLWRGRDRASLLEALRALRDSPGRSRRRSREATAEPGDPTADDAQAVSDVLPTPGGAAAALAEIPDTDLAELVDRYWYPPVPLPARPPVLDAGVDLVLRQLPTPPATLGGAELAARLRERYAAFAGPGVGTAGRERPAPDTTDSGSDVDEHAGGRVPRGRGPRRPGRGRPRPSQDHIDESSDTP
jgi:uncharacterized Zn finger protein